MSRRSGPGVVEPPDGVQLRAHYDRRAVETPWQLRYGRFGAGR